ncbi:RagB/SusD family nutrient uptake outer membrane protein [Pontibacter rugosus]
MRNVFYFKNKLRFALMAPALAFSLMITSCEKQTLDEITPSDSLTEASAFTTPERIMLAMNGVYDAAQSGFYANNAVRGYPFGAASIEQGDTRGEDVLNVATFYQITYEGTQTTSSANNLYMWETLYALINRANVVIEGLQGAAEAGTITQEQADAYVAECRFLRALAHHELLTNFARPYNETPDASHPGIPYRTMPINSSDRVDEASAQGRNTVKEAYELLLQDLDYAENNLPAERNEQIIKATQGAAIALKTRVKLHMRDWSGVITEAEKLVSGTTTFTSPIGGYSLTETPEGPFANDDSNTESIFSIQNSSNDNASVNGSLANMYSGANRALIAISPIIWNAAFWPEDDLRRTQLTAEYFDGERYTTKYRDLAAFSDNAPVIRYAEVLLNYSEAITRTQGVTDKALALLNAVRGRATDAVYATSGATAPYLNISSPSGMLIAIGNERRIEFLAEGLRWKDIHRTAKEGDFGFDGIPAKVYYNETVGEDWDAASGSVRAELLNNIPARDYEDNAFLWPIPISEVNANPVLVGQQNPGY